MKSDRTIPLIAVTVFVAALAFAAGAVVRARTTEAPAMEPPESARTLDANHARWRTHLVRADPGRLRRPAPRATAAPVPVNPTTAAVAVAPAVAPPPPAPESSAPVGEGRIERRAQPPVDREFDLEG